MNWTLFWATFASIFLAELGDKTQLSVLLFSSNAKSPLLIFLAASLALVSATLIGVTAGTILSKFIDPKWIKIAGGILFIVIGVWILFKNND